MGRTKKHRKNKVDFKHCKVTDTTPTHGMPGRPTDRRRVYNSFILRSVSCCQHQKRCTASRQWAVWWWWVNRL